MQKEEGLVAKEGMNVGIYIYIVLQIQSNNNGTTFNMTTLTHSFIHSVAHSFIQKCIQPNWHLPYRIFNCVPRSLPLVIVHTKKFFSKFNSKI